MASADGSCGILRTADYGNELRALYTALGIHFPEQRAVYFARAEELDRDAGFPHLFTSICSPAFHTLAAALIVA